MTRPFPRLPSALAAWLLLACLLASPARAALDVADPFDGLNLGPQVQLLEDVDREFTIDDLLSRDDDLPWRSSEQETLNFSFSDSAWWLQVELVNASEAPLRRLLELAMPLHDYLDAWVVDEAGEVVAEWQTGNRRAFDTRPVAHRTFVLPIVLPPGETRRVILRLDTHDGLFDATPLYLLSDASFLQKAQRELMAFSLYFGALLALMIFNLLLFLAIRERSLLHYVVYLGTFFVLMFAARGFAYQYWWPNWPTFNNQMLPLTIGLFAVTLASFSSSYLNLRRHAPRLSWGLHGVAGLCLASALPALQGHYAPVFRVMIPAAILLSLLMLSVAVWRSWLGDRLAQIFLVAWCVLLVGIALYFLRVAGVLPYNVFTEYAVQAGSGIEFLLLAFGLAYKINLLKNEKLAAERATHELQRSHNQRLEAEVDERTRELEAANQRLAAMARTDPLTGLLNRRQFHELVDAELLQRRRSGRALLFAVMDIDAFKAYNDTYGHQAGDEVLRRVSALLQQHFRRAGDRLFRLGGEEFGLLLEVDTLDQGRHVMEAFRQSLEDLAIPHVQAEGGVVTASFGLVCCNDFQRVPDAERLYREADEAMYQAKDRNRNRVVTRAILGET
ncbi:diguanylate cyclase [Halomonas sp. PGE1]|uniref:sensor domain-containing diguanylate cyclase n=1 Tax=Halomonas sp. PGE1 TaxID=2730360 RepID=UPI001474C1E2|nr:diguanylate cyclase [Halomonas sp. PGE1]QJR00113.1 diguanylate cyclase [Halomonas sp. PGE1]